MKEETGSISALKGKKDIANSSETKSIISSVAKNLDGSETPKKNLFKRSQCLGRVVTFLDTIRSTDRKDGKRATGTKRSDKYGATKRSSKIDDNTKRNKVGEATPAKTTQRRSISPNTLRKGDDLKASMSQAKVVI